MSSNKNVITKDQFKMFKDECMKYIDGFGLADWSIKITCEGNINDSGSYANVHFCPDGLSAVINLTKDWCDNPITKIQILRAAIHEVCHILTARMELLAMERFVTEKEVYAESERIARRVEHLIWSWRR